MTFATLRLELPLYEMSMNAVGNKNVHVCLHSNNLLLDTWGGGEGGGVLGVFHLMFISLHVLFLHSFFSHTQKNEGTPHHITSIQTEYSGKE